MDIRKAINALNNFRHKLVGVQFDPPITTEELREFDQAIDIISRVLNSRIYNNKGSITYETERLSKNST